jgi:hypothetical protein
MAGKRLVSINYIARGGHNFDRETIGRSEEHYQNLFNGKPGLWPVGFPKGDVFRYNSSQENFLKNWQNDPALWDHLVSYV